MRRIPPTIASQHPDNASAPFWDKSNQPFIGAYREMDEALVCFKDLGVSEYMWDWEGKHADAAVIDRLLNDHYDYFSKVQLGRDKFLTFRIPNIWEEKGYNLMQAMTVVLSGEDMAEDIKLKQRPLFEVILPMTERADQLIQMQQLFAKLAHFKSEQFTADRKPNDDYLEMIPLVESVASQLNVKQLLSEYIKLHQKHFKTKPDYMRVFFACSDSALMDGFMAGILANKLFVVRLYEFQAKSGIKIFPFAGPGSLRFRGGLSPLTVDRFLQEYAGVRTVTIQSAFRYDNPLSQVKSAIKKLEKELAQTKAPKLDPADQVILERIIKKSAEYYHQTLEQIVVDMQPIFKAVPRRRDRRQHIGLLAYARNVGGNSLPRAITFTAGFYSVGLPPEFIGFGRTLKELSQAEINVLKRFYPNMAQDFTACGRFLNSSNIIRLAERNKGWRQTLEDVNGVAEVLNVSFAPKTAAEKEHQELSSMLLQTKNLARLTSFINEMAVLRHSLG